MIYLVGKPLPTTLETLIKRFLSLLLLALILYFYGEELLPYVGEGLHVLGEFLELMLEHFFEDTLGFHRRGAEIITVWTGLMIGMFLLWLVVRGLSRLTKRAVRRSVEWEQRQARSVKDWYDSVSDWHKFLASVVLTLLAWLFFYLFL